MVRRKYDKKKYPLAKKGEPLTEKWSLRKAKIGPEVRYVLVRKIDGKKQRRFLDDKRMTPEKKAKSTKAKRSKK